MAQYAQRLRAQIQTPRPILLGLSFGGMMAVEVAKLVEARKIILLSSAATRQEIPPYYRLFGAFSLRRRLSAQLPARLFTTPNPVINWLFGVRSPEDKALLAAILKDTDPDFLVWALEAVAQWTNTEKPARLIHIHGAKDRILPIRYLHADIEIATGGHSMVLDHAREITEILRRIVRAEDVS
jgi:pimeloyl-ACP methyl ester carboxylesterase